MNRKLSLSLLLFLTAIGCGKSPTESKQNTSGNPVIGCVFESMPDTEAVLDRLNFHAVAIKYHGGAVKVKLRVYHATTNDDKQRPDWRLVHEVDSASLEWLLESTEISSSTAWSGRSFYCLPHDYQKNPDATVDFVVETSAGTKTQTNNQKIQLKEILPETFFNTTNALMGARGSGRMTGPNQLKPGQTEMIVGTHWSHKPAEIDSKEIHHLQFVLRAWHPTEERLKNKDLTWPEDNTE